MGLKRRYIITCLITIFVTSISFYSTGANTYQANTSQTFEIGISQIVEHPALDAVREGMLEELKQQGFEPGRNLKINYENAQGSVITATQIADKLLSQPLNVAVAISTPSAQTLYFAAQKQHKKIPIVFSAVSDPKTAKLLPSSESYYPITGVTDSPDLQGLVTLIQKVLPNVKTVGVIYNPSEANSVATVQNFKKLLEAQNLQMKELTISKTSEVVQAMQSIKTEVDALYLPQDNTVVSAIESIIAIADQESKPLPVFSNDPELVKKGILAAVGYDYRELGKETGKVVAKILQGQPTEKITIQAPEKTVIVLNPKKMEKMGLTIPKEINNFEIKIIN